MTAQTTKLTIQQVAAITGLSVYTLRYYERIGLIHPIGREKSTHRRYTMDDVGWIEFLNKLRATGMSIQQMLEYAILQRKGDSTLAERVDMLKAHRNKVEAHMNELQENLRIIHYKIDLYETMLAEPVAELA